MASIKKSIILLIIGASSQALANDGVSSSPYSFSGGACASQGTWTQTALGVTQELRKITLQLRDDPNCRALGASVQNAITNLEASMQSVADTPNRVSRLSALPGEIGALRTFLISNPEMKSQVLQLMMSKSIESATLGAQVQQGAGAMASSIGDFADRMRQGTNSALQFTNQVVDSIPQMEQCLTNSGGQALGQYIAGSVKMLSAFASSGETGIGSSLAQSISKITSMVRDQKYAKVLRRLNEQEFMTSMSCLIEVTTEAYCQNRDAMGLFKKGMEDIRVRQKGDSISSENPFAGYYVLNTHVPNVTKWMQKIQIGVDPKLPTDAVFQNKIRQEVTDFYKSAKTLLGDYNTTVITLKSLPNLQAKQNAVLKLISQITESMIDKQYGAGAEKTNFFTMSRTELTIPFILLGMPVPDQVSGKAMPFMRYNDWLQANLTSPLLAPIFSNPEALAESIGRNMKLIISDANLAAIEYFNKWYIVDKAALVNESMIDINYTVKDSLEAINIYLEQFKQRTLKYSKDTSLIPAVVDTQVRISKVLDTYSKVQQQGQSIASMADVNGVTAEQMATMADAYETLINTVYDQFNVMHSLSGFLANRLSNYVYADYVLLVKNKVNFTEYQQELFIASGMAAFDKMLQTYNGNPAHIQNDLNMGLRLNLGNIDAMEQLLRDDLVNMIYKVQQTEEGEQGLGRRAGRVVGDMLAEEGGDSRWDDFIFAIPKTAWYWLRNSSRYSQTTTKGVVQSEFGDATYVRSQLCIQGLAFSNQDLFANICKGAVLNSPIPGAEDAKYRASYQTEVSRYLNDPQMEPKMRASMNRSNRICAFREFNRKNMVLFMTVGQQNK